jgi:hypothetical protein
MCFSNEHHSTCEMGFVHKTTWYYLVPCGPGRGPRLYSNAGFEQSSCLGKTMDGVLETWVYLKLASSFS